MSNPSTDNNSIPTLAQLTETRLKQWHQQGEALLTMENLRAWLNAAGLVLFAPRLQIAAPGPTLVEAVLGNTNPSPTLDEIARARTLLGRLIAEGLAVPLNLLGANGPTLSGAVGETPDFVASTAVFSYVFTLRGDKAWKQSPATTGPLKVSNLALATYDGLTQRGALSAFDLTAELGKEVTEAAVLRALAELWTHLRVLPLPQPDGRPALWELTSTRFTKQIKAGANAGQPSALSALISLYLGQAVVAAEDEIESFLSPLAPRSRIRDVIHALLSARQLGTVAIEGRTLLHVAGELPVFLTQGPAPVPVELQAAAIAAMPAAPGAGEATPDADNALDAPPRITKFIPKPRKIGTGYLAKAKPAQMPTKPSFAKRQPFPASGRERRPFSKAVSPGFDKPWEEEKARRLAQIRKPSGLSEPAGDIAASESAGDAAGAPAARPIPARTPRVFKPRSDAKFSRKSDSPSDRRPPGKAAFRDKPSFGSKKSFGAKPAFGRDGSDRPSRSEGRPPRREFAPRTAQRGESDGPRPARKTFSKPGTFGRKREGFAPRPSAEAGEARPPRRDFTPRPAGGAKFADKTGFSKERPRSSERGPGAEGGKRVYRKFDTPRPDARKFDGPRDRPASRTSGPGHAGKAVGTFSRAKFSAKPGARVSAPSGARPPAKSGARPSTGPGRFAGKPATKSGRGFGGDKVSSKSRAPFAGKPTSTFAKFADNKKPFGKRPPARKFKPARGESA